MLLTRDHGGLPVHLCLQISGLCTRQRLVSEKGVHQCADLHPPPPPRWPLESQDSSKSQKLYFIFGSSVAAGQLTSLIKNINKVQCMFIYLFNENVTFLPFSPLAHSAF